MQPTRRHYVPVTEAKWRRVEKLSDYHCRSILKCHELLTLHNYLLEKGLDVAAGILAFALNEGVVLGWLRNNMSATYLVPTNEALKINVLALFKGDNKLERDKKIRKFLGRHTLLGKYSSHDLSAADGTLSIIQGDIKHGKSIIHIISKCL